MYGPQDPVQPPQNAPPLFDVLAADDFLFAKENFELVRSWRAAGAKAEFHLYQAGGHGFGMPKNGTTTELWPGQFLAWLSLNKFVSASNSDSHGTDARTETVK